MIKKCINKINALRRDGAKLDNAYKNALYSELSMVKYKHLSTYYIIMIIK